MFADININNSDSSPSHHYTPNTVSSQFIRRGHQSSPASLLPPPADLHDDAGGWRAEAGGREIARPMGDVGGGPGVLLTAGTYLLFRREGEAGPGWWDTSHPQHHTFTPQSHPALEDTGLSLLVVREAECLEANKAA